MRRRAAASHKQGARLVLWCSALLLPVVVACSSLPQDGPVHRVDPSATSGRPAAPYFAPPGPLADAPPDEIVRGFMVAMQANPLSTSAARGFLSQSARERWRPTQGTLVYEGYTVDPAVSGVQVRLSDPVRLDGRGGWQGRVSGDAGVLDLRMVSEEGQWRIDDPPDRLVIPTSYFRTAFQRFSLYFYDQTNEVLLPDPIFVPRGEQSATTLVRALLSGPAPGARDIMHTAFPPGSLLDLSVVVTENGMAEVPVSAPLLDLSAAELERVVRQLSWTLRQVPGITSVRLSVDGTPVPLAGGRASADVSEGGGYDAAAAPGDARVVGVREGRVVELSDGADPAPGPFGEPGFALRSLAVGGVPLTVAAVAEDGHTLFGSAWRPAAPRPVTRLLTGATDLLRPSYDRHGNLWVVDRAGGRARVWVTGPQGLRIVRIPGVSGRRVVAAAISLDGARLAVALGGPPGRVLMVDILRTPEGALAGIGNSRILRPLEGTSGAGYPIVDVGWREPGTLAVLSRPSAATSKLIYLSADGSPADLLASEPSNYPGVAVALVVSPVASSPLYVVTDDGRLVSLTAGGQWERAESAVRAATYTR